MSKLSIPRPVTCVDVPAQTSSQDWLSHFKHCLKPQPANRFASESRIVASYSMLRLRAFGKRRTKLAPTLIVPPLAVHDAGFVDLMRGHSLVSTLGAAGAPVYVADWIGGSSDMAGASIDTCLTELNAAIDDLGGACNVVGLGVGGCLPLIHAARFPGKIKRLVLAGAPVDVSRRPSLMTRFAARTMECGELPDSADVVSGAQRLSPLGAAQGHERAAIETLQRNPAAFARADLDAIAAYEDWAARSLDVPGRYAREVLDDIFAQNRLARGAMIALGRTVDLGKIKIPLFVLAGGVDEITPKLQALSALDLVGTPKSRMRSLVAPCGHFALFVGGRTLAREWRTIAGWLASSAPAAETAARAKAAHTMDGSVASNAP